MSSTRGVKANGAPRARRARWWVGVPVVLLCLALGVSTTWRLKKPTLEPLPSLPMDDFQPVVRKLIEETSARVAKNLGSPVAWGELGAVYAIHDLEPPAQVCFRNAERLDPDNYKWPYLFSLSMPVDEPQSIAALRRAVQRCGDRTHVQLRLVETLLDRGEFEEAAAQIARVMEHASANPRAQYANARLLLAQGKIDEAKLCAERSVANAPDKRASQLLLAHLCRRTNDASGEARALAALAQIPEEITRWEDPDVIAMNSLRQDQEAQLSRAEQLIQSQNAAQGAGILFDLAMASDGFSAAAKLAQALNRQGKHRQAELMLRQRLPAFPTDERLHFQLGVSCFLQQKYADAAAEFRRAAELKPDYFYAWHNLGLVLVKLDKPADARAALAEAIRISPNDPSPRISLAELLLAEGNVQEAQTHLEAAIAVAPDMALPRELLSKAKAAMK